MFVVSTFQCNLPHYSDWESRFDWRNSRRAENVHEICQVLLVMRRWLGSLLALRMANNPNLALYRLMQIPNSITDQIEANQSDFGSYTEADAST